MTDHLFNRVSGQLRERVASLLGSVRFYNRQLLRFFIRNRAVLIFVLRVGSLVFRVALIVIRALHAA